MRFEEEGYATIDRSMVADPFVYMLLDGDEVVYVGQSSNGIARICQHGDKTFDSVRVASCEASMLGYMEDTLIMKYKPKYNRVIGRSRYITVRHVRDMARDIVVDHGIRNTPISVSMVKRVMATSGIETHVFDGRAYVDKADAKKVASSVAGVLK